MFQSKLQLFVKEILSIIVSPIILCYNLPKCADAICEFILTTKTEIPGLGDVCGYSTFNFDKFGDECWEGRTIARDTPEISESNSSQHDEHQQQNPIQHCSSLRDHDGNLSLSLAESIIKTNDVQRSVLHFSKPKTKSGKMEKSFFSFKITHPSYKCNESGRSLIDKIEKYQKNETALVLQKERQLQLEVAARQLDTLKKVRIASK